VHSVESSCLGVPCRAQEKKLRKRPPAAFVRAIGTIGILPAIPSSSQAPDQQKAASTPQAVPMTPMTIEGSAATMQFGRFHVLPCQRQLLAEGALLAGSAIGNNQRRRSRIGPSPMRAVERGRGRGQS
jgi:hypothetical protein